MAINRAQSGVRVVGVREAQRYLRDLADASRNAAKAAVQVGSPLGYAYGIETGVHRGGRLARRAGGVFYLTRALEHERPSIVPTVAKALDDGPHAALDAMKRIGFNVERTAKALVVRVTGTLQRSIQTIYPGRPVQDFGAGPRVAIRRLRRPR